MSTTKKNQRRGEPCQDAILRVLAAHGPRTYGQLCRQLPQHAIGTVHSALVTLKSRGRIDQAEGKRWHLAGNSSPYPGPATGRAARCGFLGPAL